MLGKVNFKVGNSSYQISIDEPKEMDTLHKMAVLGNPPSYCHECKNNQFFRLDSNKDQEGNIYVNVVCTKCGAKAKLGQYKAGGYFWKNFEKWEGKKSGSSDTQNSQNEPDTDGIEDDVPF